MSWSRQLGRLGPRRGVGRTDVIEPNWTRECKPSATREPSAGGVDGKTCRHWGHDADENRVTVFEGRNCASYNWLRLLVPSGRAPCSELVPDVVTLKGDCLPLGIAAAMHDDIGPVKNEQ